jgi:Tetratricopeptide repeat
LQTTCNLLGNIHLQDGRSDTAIFYLMKAISLAEELGYKKEIIANDKIAASTALYQNQNYKECIGFCNADIDVEKRLSRHTAVTAYNNTGLSYLKLSKPDSALFYFNKALTFCRHIKWGIWEGIISGNIGDVFHMQNKDAAAMPYWQTDYDSSMKYDEQKNAGLTLAFMSQHEFDNGQQQKALSQLQWAQTINAGDAVNLLRIYNIKAYCYRKMGKHDSADYFFKLHYALNDSVNQAVYKSNYNTVQMRLNFEKNERDFKIIKSQRQAEINKRNLLLGTILALLIFGLLLYNRQRLKIKLALQQKEIAEAEKKSAKEQLQIFTDILLEKNEQIENLNASLQKQNTINTDELIHQTLLTDYDWNRFKDLFEKTYPDFFTSLKNAASNITAAEMRLAALIKLNLDNKQMASMQGISVSSLRGYKTRLRQKLNITAEIDLEELIKQL